MSSNSVPQLVALVQSRSSRGLSLQSLVLELWAYLTMLSYSWANDYPLSMYAEICLFHISIGIHLIPISVSVILIQLGNPIGWYSKGLQLWTIVKNKDSGQVSALTWSLNACSCASRLTTLYLSIMDGIVVTTLIVSFFLNTGVAIAAHIYRPKIKTQ
ncbi:unnamed protein product [Oppiella nova]|uniref:Uncharacterized protein n=1 Tax=Oppiella nova TaxID=334625 RepID=A0A7R9QFL1_9ACAR|nr:unnamed protein product [Oppiella nova]CAG2164770.1 unnamed protein product [Oppiella nova]